MPDFWDVFPTGNVFLPVIHVISEPQVLRNVKIACDQGADGVFLISHGFVSASSLLRLYQSAREVYPSWWIGLNFLDLATPEALQMVSPGVSGLWVDDAGVSEDVENSSRYARLFWKQRQKREDWPGLYFGGVAFKYQLRVQNVGRAAQFAAQYMDVITTSGDATGEPPAVKKIQAMREAIGEHPLAIASGITPENVGEYLGVADCFLVATGISKSFTELDPARVKELAQIIHSS